MDFGEPAFEVGPETRPIPAGTSLVAATPERPVPEAADRRAELFQPCIVPGDGMILEPSLDDTSEPLTLDMDRRMHLFTELRLDLSQLRSHALGYGDPSDLVRSPTGCPAAVRESEIIECLGLPLASSVTVWGCESPKFDQPCLFRV